MHPQYNNKPRTITPLSPKTNWDLPESWKSDKILKIMLCVTNWRDFILWYYYCFANEISLADTPPLVLPDPFQTHFKTFSILLRLIHHTRLKEAVSFCPSISFFAINLISITKWSRIYNWSVRSKLESVNIPGI